MKGPLSFLLCLALAVLLAANVQAWVVPRILRRGGRAPTKSATKKFTLFQAQVVENPVIKTPQKNGGSSVKQENMFETATASRDTTVADKETTKSKPWWLELLMEAAAAVGITKSDKNVPASSKDTTGITTGLEREPLASEGIWTAYFDLENTGLVYYFNEETGESQWYPPTSTFPSVKLPAKLNRIIQAKKQEYVVDAMPKPVLRKVPRSVEEKREQSNGDEEVNDLLLPYGGGYGAIPNDGDKPITDSVDADLLAAEGDWAAYWDRDGTSFIFYYNLRTGKSQWDPPTKTFPELDLTEDMKIRTPPANDTSTRALATQGDWTAYLDAKDTCMIFYHNHKSGKSQWEKPTDDFPQIRVPQKMQRRLLLVRQQQQQGSEKA